MSAALGQLEFPLEPTPRDGEELLARLRSFGLHDVQRLRLTDNRTVMVSVHRGVLRVHRAYLEAPRDVHAAIVVLVHARTRVARARATCAILAFPVPLELRRPRRAPTTSLNDRDARFVARLQEAHRDLNAHHFAGTLSPVAIRLSTKMRSRLGHFAPATGHDPAHIAISRRHLRRDGWAAVTETLLHEMVHQWQSEHGLPLGHGAQFRAKCRELKLHR